MIANMTAKIAAARRFRRWSYDDQEGDNDVTIILQPSDLHDIEKRGISEHEHHYNFTRTPAELAGLVSITATRTSSPTTLSSRRKQLRSLPKTPMTDLKLAQCLLDQDYNTTVRLFIQKSALNWNFNSFTFDAMCCGRSLTELLLHLFNYYDLYRIFKLDIINVLKCFKLLEFGYHSTNPYHNSIHAADVTQAMHCFIQESKIRRHMTHLETLCSILAAVCHDLDHPGVNQSFLVATQNPLASLYNNNSVLENHHWRFALCIFKETQLFDHFEDDILSEIKHQLKQLILATDIARQNEYLKRFKDLTSSRRFSMKNIDDRALVLQMALKCADLGNPCRPWVISRVWSNLICDEFYNMGKIERQLGIPLTPICQREKTSIAGIQTDFFRFIVLPLLELWHKFLESPLSSLLMSNFEHNYQRWQRANTIVQQLRRRKSVACFEPLPDSCDVDEFHEHHTQKQSVCRQKGDGHLASDLDDKILDQKYSNISNFHSRHSYDAIKRASSDYVKSGNGKLELLRNLQLDRIIERSPLFFNPRKTNLNKKPKKGQYSRLLEINAINNEQNKIDDIKKPVNPLQSVSESLHPILKSHTNIVEKQQSIVEQQVFERRISNEQQQKEQKSRKDSRKTPSNNPIKSLPVCSSNYRKALSPIEDGDTSSPDQKQMQQHKQQEGVTKSKCGSQMISESSAFAPSLNSDNSSSSCSSPVSRTSSACSSSLIHRSASSRTSIDQLVGTTTSLLLPRHVRQQQYQQQRTQFLHRPQTQYYEQSGALNIRSTTLAQTRQPMTSSLTHPKGIYINRRRESDPGFCTDTYELATAIVWIQYQNNSLFQQKRRSSLPVCVPKRRSSK